MFGFKLHNCIVLCALGLLNACISTETDLSNTPERPTWFVEGTPQTIGVLNYLNRATTTFDVLRDEVQLPLDAANGISDARNGRDGALGTADDVFFQTLMDVIGLHSVSESDIVQLYAYTEQYGLVPQGDERLGEWDGQTFTVSDAERVVWVANTTDEDLLDIDAALDQRAVSAIVDARPIHSIAELADLHFVGPGTMERLVVYAQEVYPNWGRSGECTPSFTAAPWSIVTQTNQLFALMPEGDGQHALYRDTMSGCSDFIGNRDWENKVSRFLWARWMRGEWAHGTPSTGGHAVQPWSTGGVAFIDELTRIESQLNALADAFPLLPVLEPNTHVLFHERALIFDELMEDVHDRPLDFVEQTLMYEQDGCLQHSVVLMDLSHDTVLVLERKEQCSR